MRQTKTKLSEKQRARRSAAPDQLEQLKQFTRVVADTSDFQKLAEFAPEDATTNPSLVLKAAQMPGYAHLVDKAVHDLRGGSSPDSLRLAMESLLVLFGAEILKLVSGRVSTETDASLSFDTPGLVDQAHRFIEDYRRHGVERDRVLVKLASTWEGIRAGEILEREGIHCNMTLLFCLPQAAACADAGAKLISPFVGRILDWHRKKTGNEYAPADDPGVQSVREIYCYYKKHGYPTEVMGASFRSREEVLELAGCDLLTISPDLLAELKESREPVERKLSVEKACRTKLEKLTLDEKCFRWRLNEDEMATELLAKGIRSFHADAMKLKALLEKQIAGGKAFAA